MKYRLGDLIAALAAVGCLPGASVYHGELREIIDILAQTAITAANLKKKIVAMELADAEKEKEGKA